MPTVVEYCGVIHCGTFASLSILYGALDSVLFIALCSHENSSSPSHSIPGSHIPVCNIDRKFHHGRVHWSLNGSLGRSALRVPSDSSPCSICLGILEVSMCAICPSHLRHQDRRMGYSDSSSSRSSDGHSSLPDEGGSASQVPQASVQLAGYGSVVWPDSLSEWLVGGAGLQ